MAGPLGVQGLGHLWRGREWGLIHGDGLVTNVSVSESLSLAHTSAGLGRETEAEAQLGSLDTTWE